MIKIPGQQGWKQSNRSSRLGTLTETFNVDLESNLGNLRTTRTKALATGDGTTDKIGPTPAIVYFNTQVSVFSGLSSSNLWEGGNSPFDSLTRNTNSPFCGIDDGDAVVFNNELYVTTGSDINRWNGVSSNSVSTGLTDNGPHLLTTFDPGGGDRLYVGEDNDKIWSVSQANALASSGSYTLDLGLEPDYAISVLMAGTNRIWAAFSSAGNNSGAGRSIVIEWDGVTENTISNKYYINASRIMAGVVKDDVPYLVDSTGRLLQWYGGSFQEVDRFPLNGATFSTSSNLQQNSIHPRGMAIDKDEILICATNKTDTPTTYTFNDFPSGVWAWGKDTGLYHKYSPSYQAIADTGTTNLTDHGQFRAEYGGAIKVFEVNNPTSSDAGRVLFGMSYFTNGTATSSSESYGVFVNDTPDDTQKASYFITPRIHSSILKDNWRSMYSLLSDLETTGDLVEIKYRTTDEERTYATATWKDDGSSFVTNDDISDFEEGDEVQIVQGTGSGECVNIDYINGTKVQLDRVLTGVSGTSTVAFQKWKKITAITDKVDEEKTIDATSGYIQFKVFCRWTGPREFYNLIIDNISTV